MSRAPRFVSIMLKSARPLGLGIFALLALLVFYATFSDISRSLSPQGCRMSWMTPSYVLQSQFNSSRTPLGSRYSLYLYREVGWDAEEITGNSVPVLFIPGNAGSCRQIRSVASSATRQYYSSPRIVASEFASRSLKPLDFFTVEFNEDLSAFHGTTLKSQIAYVSSAIEYILSLYPPNTSIIVMGHSMGGIVATSLLPSDRISAIITLSAPHTLPPARFDARIDELYRSNMQVLLSEPTPIVSLCGGAADMMIPSESCILPSNMGDVYRKTVFTSALEGGWTGVGHQEMVWCHQIRWRIARAALELGKANTPDSRGLLLDTWLRDGHTLPPSSDENDELRNLHHSSHEIIPDGLRLQVQRPTSAMTYLLSIPPSAAETSPSKFVLFVSQGSIGSVSPHNRYPLTVTVYTCSSVLDCRSLHPTTLRLIPNPIPRQTFPVPDEGSDESEGVVLYEGEVSRVSEDDTWLAVRVEDGDGRGWVIGGFSDEQVLDLKTTATSLFFGGRSTVPLKSNSLKTTVKIPALSQHALLVYRLVSRYSAVPCFDTLLSPLIMHTPHSVETHYFPLHHPPQRRILLHSHAPAPFIDPSPTTYLGLNFTVYSAIQQGCEPITLEIMIDWSATIGRWVCRYPTTIGIWATGVAALLMFNAWGIEDKTRAMPTVEESLSNYIRRDLPILLACTVGMSVLPLPARYYLGNSGKTLFWMIGPLLLMVSSGLVCISWWLLAGLAWLVGRIARFLSDSLSRENEATTRRTTMTSMGAIFVSIFLLIPWQVAFLGAWMIHLHTCASSAARPLRYPGSASCDAAVALISIPVDGPKDTHGSFSHANHVEPERWTPLERANKDRHNWHLLLFMTWLLPLVAPVLAVWVKTLATAGYTTPFDGDHNFLIVAPFLVLVDFASWTPGPLFVRHSLEDRISVRWSLAVVALTAFLIGSRRSYDVFNCASIAFTVIVIARVGRTYLTTEDSIRLPNLSHHALPSRSEKTRGNKVLSSAHTFESLVAAQASALS